MAKKNKKRLNQSVDEPRESVAPKTEVRRVEADRTTDSSIVRNIVIVVLVLIGLYFLMNLISNRDDKGDDGKTADDTSQVEDADKTQDDGKKSEAEKTTPGNLPADTTVNETDKAFNYTVGEGESFTTLARRAVASTDSKLTTAERVAAETKLTTDAGAEMLAIGQGVTLSKDTVRAAVDWAKSLSSEEKAAWQPYADLVAW